MTIERFYHVKNIEKSCSIIFFEAFHSHHPVASANKDFFIVTWYPLTPDFLRILLFMQHRDTSALDQRNRHLRVGVDGESSGGFIDTKSTWSLISPASSGSNKTKQIITNSRIFPNKFEYILKHNFHTIPAECNLEVILIAKFIDCLFGVHLDCRLIFVIGLLTENKDHIDHLCGVLLFHSNAMSPVHHHSNRKTLLSWVKKEWSSNHSPRLTQFSSFQRIGWMFGQLNRVLSRFQVLNMTCYVS